MEEFAHLPIANLTPFPFPTRIPSPDASAARLYPVFWAAFNSKHPTTTRYGVSRWWSSYFRRMLILCTRHTLFMLHGGGLRAPVPPPTEEGVLPVFLSLQQRKPLDGEGVLLWLGNYIRSGCAVRWCQKILFFFAVLPLEPPSRTARWMHT